VATCARTHSSQMELHQTIVAVGLGAESIRARSRIQLSQCLEGGACLIFN
jgi:hypothetical protein